MLVRLGIPDGISNGCKHNDIVDPYAALNTLDGNIVIQLGKRIYTQEISIILEYDR